MPNPTTALLDANVLCSNHLRNLLLQIAYNDLFDVKWSAAIQDEWLRNMQPATQKHISSYTLRLIGEAFPNALVGGFDPHREIGKTDAGDRHVASAAASIAPCILVTDNLRHFDVHAIQALDVIVKSTDAFLCDLFQAKPEVVETATREACANLKKTRPTWDEYLDSLAIRCKVPKFVAVLRAWTPPQDQDFGPT